MNSQIDPNSDSARLAAHRKASSALGGIPPHPSTGGWVHIDSIDTDHALRTRLVDRGWTPPNAHTIEPIPTVAWQHPARADLVTSDPHAYTGLSAGKPHELVQKDAVYDRMDWLEHGVDEWRTYAIEAGKQLMAARDEIAALKAKNS